MDKEFGDCNKTIEKLTEEDVRVREDMKNVKKRLKKVEKDIEEQNDSVNFPVFLRFFALEKSKTTLKNKVIGFF